jgi:MFS family permease
VSDSGEPATLSVPERQSSTGDIVLCEYAPEGKQYLWYIAGALISNIGTWMFAVAVPYVVVERSGSPALVGLSGLLLFLPSLAGALAATKVIAKLGHRRAMLGYLATGAVFLAMLTLAWETTPLPTGVLLALLVPLGVLAGGVLTSGQVGIAVVVPEERLTRAVALYSGQVNLARALGPALGGILLGWGGVSTVFATTALTSVTWATVVAFVVPPDRQSRVLSNETATKRSSSSAEVPVLRLGLALVFVASFAAMPILQLASVVAERLDVDSELFGLIAGSFGAGATVGVIAVRLGAENVPKSILVGVGLILAGAGTVGFGYADSVVVAALSSGVAGLGFLLVTASTNAAIHAEASDENRATVLAKYVVALGLGYPLGALSLGALADVFGLGSAMVFAGVLLYGMALVLVVSPSRRALLDGVSQSQIEALART